MEHSHNFKVRLGLFIALGIGIFVLAIFIIGRQKNLFDPVFRITADFYNVSGLQVGNNVRFSGINVGTVDNIRIVNDSTVRVDMLIRSEIRQFIKTDCEVTIGSEGIIGDRILVINQGSSDASLVKDGQRLSSNEPVETDAIFESLEITTAYAEVISQELAEIMMKINNGSGTLGKLIQDTTIAENLDKTIKNLRSSSKGLDENMEAAKNSFLLRGFFNKKERERKRKLQQQAEDKKEAEEAKSEDNKNRK